MCTCYQRRFRSQLRECCCRGLAAPFYVALASQNGQQALRGLGVLVLMAGLANLASGHLWGRLADHCSRVTMAFGGALCALLSLTVDGRR